MRYPVLKRAMNPHVWGISFSPMLHNVRRHEGNQSLLDGFIGSIWDTLLLSAKVSMDIGAQDNRGEAGVNEESGSKTHRS